MTSTSRRRRAVPRNASRRSLELLEDLAGVAEHILTSEHGMPADQAQAAASAITRRLAAHWGGQQLYFPQVARILALTERDAELLARFDGTNRDALCQEYNISVRRFYQILDARRSFPRSPPP